MLARVVALAVLATAAATAALAQTPVEAALTALPGLRVLALSHDGRSASLHELRPHCELLGEVSAERLVEIICAHAIGPVAT